MLFSSLEFLLLFLPVTALIYYIIPKTAKNYWLLLTSLFFYAWGEPKFVIVMVVSILSNYLAARALEQATNIKRKKLILALSVVFNLGLLFVFKYLNFTSGILHSIFPSVTITKIVLPIGISFFTFQAMSYVIDVYRGLPAQKNICFLGLYISFFPQLIAGPIVRYSTIMEQIIDRRVTAEDFSEGLKRFLVGFNKKLLLANAMAEVADFAFSSSSLSVSMAWLGMLCYDFQIFFDFSAYSDMAIGLGRMFGFRFLENFNYPYISKTVTEFWRRWHISLGSWFRDYLYFPLGGSRVSKRRLIFNLSIVWILTGIWHGADYTFILWGVLHCIVLILEKLNNIPKKIEKGKKLRILGHIYTLFAVTIGWVFFRAENMTQLAEYLKAMFALAGNSFADASAVFYLREYAVIIAACIICSTPLLKMLGEKIDSFGKPAAALSSAASWGIQIVFFLIGISFLVMNAYNPFIYFNF